MNDRGESRPRDTPLTAKVSTNFTKWRPLCPFNSLADQRRRGKLLVLAQLPVQHDIIQNLKGSDDGNNPEDTILHIHRRENLKSIKNVLFTTLRASPSILSNRYNWALSLGGKRPGRETHHSPQISSKVAKIWNYRATYDVMAQCLIRKTDFTVDF
jgi:hypothetical protein